MPNTQLTDLPTADLLNRIPGGDQDARTELFTRYRSRVLTIVRARLGARLGAQVDADDLLQEALLEAVKDLNRFEMRDDSSLIRWLAVLVVRRISAHARYAGALKRSAVEEDLDSLPRHHMPPDAREPSPSGAMASREESDLVCEALASLPETQRELVLLRNYAGATWEAIAAELSMPSPDAARMTHARALAKLGAHLRHRGLGTGT